MNNYTTTSASAKWDWITQLCFAYLRTKDESARAARFKELARHCKRCLGRLYPANPHQTILSIRENGGSRSDGLPRVVTDDPRSRTREFVETWLLWFFLPYRDCSLQELERTAQKGTFRFIGNQCRKDLIDLLRGPKSVEDSRILDDMAETDDGMAESLSDFVTRNDAIDPVIWIEKDENREELTRLGIYEVCRALGGKCMDGESASRSLALLWNVSPRQAQRRVLQTVSRIRGELRYTQIVRELFNVLMTGQKPMYRLAIEPSQAAHANDRLMEQALQDMQDFWGWQHTNHSPAKESPNISSQHVVFRTSPTNTISREIECSRSAGD